MHRNDGGVLELRGDLGFGDEARELRFTDVCDVEQHLDRDDTLELGIVGLDHPPHPPASQLALNDIATELLEVAFPRSAVALKAKGLGCVQGPSLWSVGTRVTARVLTTAEGARALPLASSCFTVSSNVAPSPMDMTDLQVQGLSLRSSRILDDA